MNTSVLVVAHNSDIATLLVTLLRLHGYRANSASTAQEALERIQQSQPALIYLDAPLPDMLAQEFVRCARRHTFAPLVLLTTRDDGPAIARRISADAFIPKPFDLGNITACLSLIQHQPLERAVGA